MAKKEDKNYTEDIKRFLQDYSVWRDWSGTFYVPLLFVPRMDDLQALIKDTVAISGASNKGYKTADDITHQLAAGLVNPSDVTVNTGTGKVTIPKCQIGPTKLITYYSSILDEARDTPDLDKRNVFNFSAHMNIWHLILKNGAYDGTLGDPITGKTLSYREFVRAVAKSNPDTFFEEEKGKKTSPLQRMFEKPNKPRVHRRPHSLPTVDKSTPLKEEWVSTKSVANWIMTTCGRNMPTGDMMEGSDTSFVFYRELKWLYKSVQALKPNVTSFGNQLGIVGCRHHYYDKDKLTASDMCLASWQGIQHSNLINPHHQPRYWGAVGGVNPLTAPSGQIITPNNGVYKEWQSFRDGFATFGGEWELAFWSEESYYRNKGNFKSAAEYEAARVLLPSLQQVGSVYATTVGTGELKGPGNTLTRTSSIIPTKGQPTKGQPLQFSIFVGETVGARNDGHSGDKSTTPAWFLRFVAMSNDETRQYHPMWSTSALDDDWKKYWFMGTSPGTLAKINKWASFSDVIKFFNNDYASKGKVDSLWWMMNRSYDHTQGKSILMKLGEGYLDLVGMQDRKWHKGHMQEVKETYEAGLKNTWTLNKRIIDGDKVINAGLADGAALAPIFGYRVWKEDPTTGSDTNYKYPIYTLYMYCWLMNALLTINESSPDFPLLKLMLDGNITLPKGKWNQTPIQFDLSNMTKYEGTGLAGEKPGSAESLQQFSHRESFRNFLNLFEWMFKPLSKAQKVLDDIRKENDSVDKKSSLVSQNPAQAKQFLILNSQCYMLNTIDKFQAKHKAFSHGLVEHKSYSTIVDDCKNLPNVLFHNKEITPILLNAQPLTLASLQPRIKLFKKRPQFSGYGTTATGDKIPWMPPSGKSLEVFAPFDTHQDFKPFNASGVAARQRGSGIKRILVAQEHGNAAFKVAELTKIEIVFHFNRLDEIFINWPAVSEDGTVTYPFGFDGTAGTYASVAELVFPVSQNTGKDAMAASASKMSMDAGGQFSIVLQFGWGVNQTLSKQIKDRNVMKKLKTIEKNKGALTKEFVLTPVNSDFSIAEDGTIELKIEYYGILEEKERNAINRMFPRTAIEMQNSATINTEIGKINKELRKLKGQNHKKAQNRKDSLKARLKKLNIQSHINNRENFLSNQLSTFVDSLLKNNAYHRVTIPSALLGVRSGKKDPQVVKWSPYSELDTFRQFEFSKQLIQDNKTGWVIYHAKDLKASKGNILKDLKASLQLSLSHIEKAKRASRSGDGKYLKKTAKEYMTAAKTAFTNMQKSVAPKVNEDHTHIDFIFLGDIIEIFLRRSFESAFRQDIDLAHGRAWDANDKTVLKALKNKYKKPEEGKGKRDYFASLFATSGAITAASHNLDTFIQERVMFVLGTLDVPLLVNNKKQAVRVNIASLPIHAQILVDFITDEVIRRERYDISYVEFITNFYAFVLKNYFTQVCFDADTGISSIQPQINFFDLLSGLKGTPQDAAKMAKDMLIPIGQNEGKSFSRDKFEKMFENYQTRKTDKTNKQIPLTYCYMGGTSVDVGSFNYAKDKANGIHHFYIGGATGLVKKIDFKSKEIKGRAEALYFSEGGTADSAMFMIPRIYDVVVTMVGNNLFESGQTFFVDPTMGTLLYAGNSKNNTGLNLIKNTGLGGYFYISKVETSISAGEYETILHGIKVGLALNDDDQDARKVANLLANNEALNSNSLATLERVGADKLPPTDATSQLVGKLKDLLK